MSYHCYTIDGYGICLDSVEDEVTVEKLEALLQKSTELWQRYETWKKDFEPVQVADILMDFVEENTDCGYGGLATILQEVIWENDQFGLEVAEDFDGSHFLLYTPRYPWNMDLEDVSITKVSIQDIVQPYLDILTDEKVVFDYQEVENGG